MGSFSIPLFPLRYEETVRVDVRLIIVLCWWCGTPLVMVWRFQLVASTAGRTGLKFDFLANQVDDLYTV